jgi:biopolymer transport protein ExbD
MKLTHQNRKTSISMNITPMIDIVFLLIIFFITVSQISEVNNPPMELTKLAGAEEIKPSKLTINIDEAGEIEVSGTTLTVAELMSRVANEVEALNNQPSLLTIVIRQDRRGACRTINQVIEQLNDFGIKKIAFRVLQP